MAKPRGIKPGQIPDWRPGATFWKPLADGREVTVYPLLGGKGRLCIGPLADPHGYDIAFRYTTVAQAEQAAKDWDGESTEEPAGYEGCDFGRDRHPATISNPSESSIPKVGDFMMPTESDSLKMSQDMHGASLLTIERELVDGRQVTIIGAQKTRTDGVILCLVESIEINVPPEAAEKIEMNKVGTIWEGAKMKLPNPDIQFKSFGDMVERGVISPGHGVPHVAKPSQTIIDRLVKEAGGE